MLLCWLWVWGELLIAGPVGGSRGGWWRGAQQGWRLWWWVLVLWLGGVVLFLVVRG